MQPSSPFSHPNLRPRFRCCSSPAHSSGVESDETISAPAASVSVAMKTILPQFVALESRTHFAAAPWAIWADHNPDHLADAITLRLNPNDTSQVQAIVNHRTITRRLAGIRSIVLHAGRGNDSVTLGLPKS